MCGNVGAILGLVVDEINGTAVGAVLSLLVSYATGVNRTRK